MRLLGSVLAGVAAFLGIMVVQSGTPVIGVVTGVIGGTLAGYVMREESNQ